MAHSTRRLVLLVALVASVLGVHAAPVTAARPFVADRLGDRVIVFWRDGGRQASPSLAGVAAAHAGRGWTSPRLRPGSRRAALDRLAQDPRVWAILPDVPVRVAGWPASGTPSDTGYASQWDLPLIGMGTAWARTTGSASVTVAVLDTGLTAAHQDLSAATVVAPHNAITRRAT